MKLARRRQVYDAERPFADEEPKESLVSETIMWVLGGMGVAYEITVDSCRDLYRKMCRRKKRE